MTTGGSPGQWSMPDFRVRETSIQLLSFIASFPFEVAQTAFAGHDDIAGHL